MPGEPDGRRARGAAAVLISFLAACGGGHSAALAPIRLLHDPPIARLSAEQLRSLSMECDKYPRHDAMRGRYDAAYCDEAMAAWADSPLQMLTIPPPPPLPLDAPRTH